MRRKRFLIGFALGVVFMVAADLSTPPSEAELAIRSVDPAAAFLGKAMAYALVASVFGGLAALWVRKKT